ncbi:hypothetical protein ACOME3_009934 [Neoechinorhynchus agilis]
MTEITGSDLDANQMQTFGSAFPQSGNLVSTSTLGTFSSGGFTGHEYTNASSFPVDSQVTAASYESYGQSEIPEIVYPSDARNSLESYSYESSAGGLSVGPEGGGIGMQFSSDVAPTFTGASFGSSSIYNAGRPSGPFGTFDSSGAGLLDAGGFSTSSTEFASSGVVHGTAPVLPLNAYRVQVDANPIVIRRTMAGVTNVHRQNIIVRFLRPPAPPAPGPLIIKEVRPPQPRPAPPLIIRQRPPRPKTPPALILRERPPKMPVVAKTQTVIKRLAALPAPPRQVIIERYPALPAKPRDVIIERWLQYGPLPRRKVVYQRAAEARAYRTAKNMIIQYTVPKPSVQRVFRRLGVVSMNPLTYASQYGASLLDNTALVAAARNAGIFENLTPPGFVYASGSTTAITGGSSYSSSEELGLSGGFMSADTSFAFPGGDAMYGGSHAAGYGSAGFADEVMGAGSGGGVGVEVGSASSQFTSYGGTGFEGFDGAGAIGGFVDGTDFETSSTSLAGSFGYGATMESTDAAGGTVSMESYESSTIISETSSLTSLPMYFPLEYPESYPTVYTLKLTIRHGSTVTPLYLRSIEPILVCHLQEYIEDQCLVPVCMQRLYYEGQYLHRHPDMPLSAFQIFNNSEIVLAGAAVADEDDVIEQCSVCEQWHHCQ